MEDKTKDIGVNYFITLHGFNAHDSNASFMQHSYYLLSNKLVESLRLVQRLGFSKCFK